MIILSSASIPDLGSVYLAVAIIFSSAIIPVLGSVYPAVA
jgi:hypothetical protein